ncbi:MAG: hypothetical protein Q8M65_09650 [Rhodoglobus sp.]|nr:hypothetical protein [Rhodoglobus sp.]
MSVFSDSARRKADRAAAIVGGAAFAIGIFGVVFTAVIPGEAPPSAETTVVSSAIPGEAITMTVRSTTPPYNPTNTPRVVQEDTVTEGGGPGTVVITTAPAEYVAPFLGSSVAGIAFQVVFVTLASLLLAFATQSILLGNYGLRRAGTPSGGVGFIDESEAAAVKGSAVAAGETADLSRPLFARRGIPDARLGLLESRITLELEVRKLAQHSDLSTGLTIPYVVKDLIAKKKMSPKLGSAVVELSSIGDRISRGAEISVDTTTLLTEAYAQALARVGGKIK